MGNWNRRWVPRRKYYNYQEPPPSPPESQSCPHGLQNNSVPSWEVNFCKSMGVTWRRVIAAKKYIYCYDNVFKWNDFGAEEAFSNAKERYWTRINGLPCDSPLPDPDIFIDTIDWNPYIDPQLMSELDQEYFNPDGAKSERLDSALKEVSSEDDKNVYDSVDPWERSVKQGTGNVKSSAQNWGQWDTETESKTTENPWEQSSPQVENSLITNAWKSSGDGSWEWNQGQKHNSFWTQGYQNGESVGTRGWGREYNKSWSSNKWKPDACEPSYPTNKSNYWGNNNSGGNSSINDRRREGWRNNSQGWNQSEFVNNELKYFDVRGQRGDGNASYGGCRKREGHWKNASRYKISRFQANDNGPAYQWQR